MKIIVLGANSQIAKSLEKIQSDYPKFELKFVNRQKLDITDNQQLDTYLKVSSVEAIINCAAYTNVEKAEDEFEQANQVNNIAVAHLAKIAKAQNIKLIHISTDYVFDGTKATSYQEDDSPNPLSAYGKTKLAGEKALLEESPDNSTLIRTSWLYSEFGTNFVKAIIKKSDTESELKVVNDQTGSPTYAQDLAVVILNLVQVHKSKGVEIYHYANEGVCNFNEFAKEIVKQQNKNTVITEITTQQLNQKAKRPKYSALNTDKIKSKYKIKIPNWKASLKKCLKCL